MSASRGLRLQEPGEPAYRVLGNWHLGASPVTYNFLHSGKLVPGWLASFWQSLPPSKQEMFFLARDNGLDPLLQAQQHRRQSGPALYLDIARSIVDLNRQVTDFKPTDIDGEWPFGPSRPWEEGAQKDIGLFTRRCFANGEPLYGAPIGLADAVRRVQEVYRPAWAAQDRVLAQGVALFGEVVLISMHSYNKWSTPNMGGKAGILRAEICVSDLNGGSADSWVTAAYADSFAKHGFQVGVNDPVSGAWALQRAAEPFEGGPLQLPPSPLYGLGSTLSAWWPGAPGQNNGVIQVPHTHRRLGVHALQIEHRKDLLDDSDATQRIVTALLRAEMLIAAHMDKSS
jgi:N-formylglutamate amidohydrolase